MHKLSVFILDNRRVRTREPLFVSQMESVVNLRLDGPDRAVSLADSFVHWVLARGSNEKTLSVPGSPYSLIVRDFSPRHHVGHVRGGCHANRKPQPGFQSFCLRVGVPQLLAYCFGFHLFGCCGNAKQLGGMWIFCKDWGLTALVFFETLA